MIASGILPEARHSWASQPIIHMWLTRKTLLATDYGTIHNAFIISYYQEEYDKNK